MEFSSPLSTYSKIRSLQSAPINKSLQQTLHQNSPSVSLFESANPIITNNKKQLTGPSLHIQRNFFSSFKSVRHDIDLQEPIIKTKPDSLSITDINKELTTLYQSIGAVEKSPIQDIAARPLSGSLQRYRSKFGVYELEKSQFIQSPDLFMQKFQDQFTRQTCCELIQELDYTNLRSDVLQQETLTHVKAGSKQSTQNTKYEHLDLKELKTMIYVKAILNKVPNQLFSSVLNGYSVLQLDDPIQLPGKYEIKERKEKHSTQVNTDALPQTPEPIHHSVQMPCSKYESIRFQIQREKLRNPKAPDHLTFLEEKLIQILDLILQDLPETKGMSIPMKLQFVLSDLGKFKGQRVFGQFKTSILLYFFKQYKALKDQAKLLQSDLPGSVLPENSRFQGSQRRQIKPVKEIRVPTSNLNIDKNTHKQKEQDSEVKSKVTYTSAKSKANSKQVSQLVENKSKKSSGAKPSAQDDQDIWMGQYN